jgi:Tol biopolymer transport system component
MKYSASSPAWSPDGRWIAFVSFGDLFLVPPDGSGIRRVTHRPADEFGPVVWSPDSTTLAIVSNRT